MTTFRCKRSGNTVSFTNENDIAGMRKHEGYDEVKEVIRAVEVAPVVESKVEVVKEKEVLISIKQRGRPKKK